MNSNYDWQKHQVNERLQARFNEAEIQRSLRQNGEGKQSFSLLDRIVRLPAIGMAALSRRLLSHERSSKPQSIRNA